jgi:hypothetical protein
MHFIQTVGYTLLECKGYEEITRELEIPQMPESTEQRSKLTGLQIGSLNMCQKGTVKQLFCNIHRSQWVQYHK